MVLTFKESKSKTRLSANFVAGEFACKCGQCKKIMVDSELVNRLQQIRDHFGVPVNVNSGYRCKTHNAAVLRLMEKVKAAGCQGFCTGYNGCPLCEPCKRKENLPCAHPEKRISCMSAYCIDVAKLADRCGLEFGWITGKLFLFGMIAYHEEDAK